MIKLIKMDDKNKNFVSFDIELEKQKWNEIQNKVLNDYAKNVKVEGFRKGKVPLSVAKKHVDPQHVLINSVDVAAKFILSKIDDLKEFKENKREVYAQPEADIIKLDENNLIIQFKYFENPVATIDNYKKLDVELISANVSDKEIDAEITNLLEQQKMISPKKDGIIKKGDLAVFDFTGYLNDKKFDGGEAKNYELEIGSNQFIPGFEDQMLGLKVGDEKDLNVSFPKDYHAKDLAGKPVIFKVKINEIKTISKPKLDDTFVKTLKFDNVSTVTELKKFIKERILDFKNREVDEKNLIAINMALAKEAKLSDEIPNVILNDEKSNIRHQFNQRLSQMKIKESDYLKYVNKTADELEKELNEQAKNNIIVYAALEYISKKEKVDITDEDLKQRYNELSKIYNISSKEVEEKLNKETLKDALFHEKLLKIIIDLNIKNKK